MYPVPSANVDLLFLTRGAGGEQDCRQADEKQDSPAALVHRFADKAVGAHNAVNQYQITEVILRAPAGIHPQLRKGAVGQTVFRSEEFARETGGQVPQQRPYLEPVRQKIQGKFACRVELVLDHPQTDLDVVDRRLARRLAMSSAGSPPSNSKASSGRLAVRTAYGHHTIVNGGRYLRGTVPAGYFP